MDNSERLEALLDRWEECRHQGQTIPPEELCRDCPELLPALRSRIAEFQGVGELVRQLPPPECAAKTPLERELVNPARGAVPGAPDSTIAPDGGDADLEP